MLKFIRTLRYRWKRETLLHRIEFCNKLLAESRASSDDETEQWAQRQKMALYQAWFDLENEYSNFKGK